MNRLFQILTFVIIGWIVPDILLAQTNDVGVIGSFSLSKDIGRFWGVKIEQELRFNQKVSAFDRSLTSIGADCSIIRKVLKAEIDYDFIYQRQIDYFEFKHRSSVGLATKLSINSFDLELRTRGQAIWRDENRGDYKFNPKYVWRNKLECTYTIFGSPLKPYVSGEIFCPLNSVNGFKMDALRAVFGTKYRVSLHSTMSLFIRYDKDIQQPNPKSILYGGVGVNYKL